MPAPLTALEQRLFERLEAAMMEGNLDGEREHAAMLAAVNDERSRLGKARRGAHLFRLREQRVFDLVRDLGRRRARASQNEAPFAISEGS